MLVSLCMETWDIPSAIDDAFYLKMKLMNRSPQLTQVELEPNWRSLCFEYAVSQEWAWFAPKAHSIADQIGPGLYQSENARMSLFWSSRTGAAEKASAVMELGNEETKEVILKVAFSDKPLAVTPVHLEEEVRENLTIREKKWDLFWEQVPHLQTSHEGLGKAYLHSLLTMFLCKWESPHFVISPFYSEAGLNGGALCDYTWGEGYISKMMTLIEKEQVVENYVQITGDRDFLSEPIDGVPLYRRLVQLVEDIESRFPTYGGLLDYSDESKYYKAKSEVVRKELSAKLWDDKTQWMKCIYPDGHEEIVYSIQLFDLIGKQILSPEQEQAIMARLNEDEFLSEYGVHSISKTDAVHFDLGDVDWSGAGAYS